jgi:hypothetical protein
VVVYGGSRSSGSCRGKVRELWRFRLSAVSSLHRQRHAAAIPGQMGGRAVLGAKFCASIFLYVRIFSSDGAAVKSPAQPSGFVPGWD